jgi:hypothetical protein
MQDSGPMHRTVFLQGSLRDAYICAGDLAQRFSMGVGRPTAYKLSIDDVHIRTLDADMTITIGKAAKALPGSRG